MNPRNSLEREIILGQLLDVECLLTDISKTGLRELFSDLYCMAMLRTFKCMELLNWSVRLLHLASRCQRKEDFDSIKLIADVATNVAHHLSRLACIYMEGARLIVARYIPGQNNLVNTKLDEFITGVFLDPGDFYLIRGGATVDDTFSQYLDTNNPPPPLQTLAVVDPEALQDLGFGETFPVMALPEEYSVALRK